MIISRSEKMPFISDSHSPIYYTIPMKMKNKPTKFIGVTCF